MESIADTEYRRANQRMKYVAIIDYKMSNLFSVRQACINVGLHPIVTSDKKIILNASGVILPGVGSFGEAMKNLSDLDLVYVIKKAIFEDKPFMGICLGYQLLFSESEEFGYNKGLEIFSGKVKKFNTGFHQNRKIKVPQIGWNQIFPYDQSKWKNSLLNGVNFGEYMYFVHSFYVEVSENEILLSKTDYEGLQYCSSIQNNNLFASQFHPEKSATEGIKIYYNFANLINGVIKI